MGDRPPPHSPTPSSDSLLRTPPDALQRPPYLLLQATAVVLLAVAAPANIDAAELAAADPVSALQRWLTDPNAVDLLRRIPTRDALQRTQALGLLAGLSALALGALTGFVLARRRPIPS